MADKPIKVPITLEIDSADAKALGDAVSKSFGGVSKVVTELANSVNSLGKGLPALLGNIDNVASSLQKTLSGLDVDKLKSFSSTANEIGGGLSAVSKGLRGIKSTDAGKITDVTSALNSLQVSTDTSKIAQLGNSLGSISTSLQGFSDTRIKNITKFSDNIAYFDRVLDSVDIAKLINFSGAVKVLGPSLGTLAQSLTPISSALSKITSGRVDNIQKLTVTITNLSNALGSAASKGFLGNATQISAGLRRVAEAAKQAIEAQRELLKVQQQNNAINRRAGSQPVVIQQPSTDRRANRPPPQQAAQTPQQRRQQQAAQGFLGTGIERLNEILPQRGPIVQVTGLLFLLQGAAFGLVRVFERLTNATLGANIALEKQVISLQAITGSFEEAKKVIQDFAIPFAANVPFFESGQIIDAVNRLAAEGFGIDEITGRLEAGFNKFTGKFEEEFEGGLIKTLGSTAVAFGRSLDQSVDAFISAIQGRFTKIRRFGIDKQDLKAFGFEEGGSDRTNARALQSALDVRFGDLIVRQAETFTGAISNIQDVLGNISRAAFEFSFKRVRDELIAFVGTLSSFEKAFSTALASEEEFEAKLKELDPIVQRNAVNLRRLSKTLGAVTDGLINAGKYLSQFAPLLAALIIPPIVVLTANLVNFTFQKLFESVGKFLGIVDRDGKVVLPKFITNLIRLKDVAKDVTGTLSKGISVKLPKVDVSGGVVDRKVLFKNLTDATDNYFSKGFFSQDKGISKQLKQELDVARKALEDFDNKVTSKNPFVNLRKGLESNLAALKNSRTEFKTLFKGIADDTLDLSKAFSKTAAELRAIPKGAAASSKSLGGVLSKGTLTATQVNVTKSLDIISKAFLKLNSVLVTLSEGKAAGALSKLFTGVTKSSSAFAGFSKLLGGSVPAVNQVISVFSTMTQRVSALGGVAGNLGKLLGGPLVKAITGIASAVTKSFTFVTKTIGTLVSVLGIVASTIVSGFVGVFKFFLIPAIFETIGALKDLIAGIESVRVKKLFELVDAFKALGSAVTATINSLLAEIGLFAGLTEGVSANTKILTRLVQIATKVVLKFRDFTPVIGDIVRAGTNLSGTILDLVGSLLKVFAILNQAIPIFRVLGDAILAVLTIIGAAFDLLTFGNTDFGSQLAKLTVQFDQSFTKINQLIFKTGEGLDQAAQKLKDFSKGVGAGSSAQKGVEQVLKGFSDEQSKGITESLANNSAEGLVSAVTGGRLEKFFKSGQINFKQLGLDKALEPFLSSEQLFTGKGGKQVSFKELFAESPAEAAAQLQNALKAPLKDVLKGLNSNEIVWGVLFNTPELQNTLGQINADIESSGKTLLRLRPIVGKVGDEIATKFKQGEQAIKNYKNALNGIAEREKERLARERALGSQITDLQVTGASDEVVNAAFKRRDRAVAESFDQRVSELSVATVIKREADAAVQAQGADLKEAQNRLQEISESGVREFDKLLKRAFPGIGNVKDKIQAILESADPTSQQGNLVNAIKAAYPTEDLDKINGLVARLISRTREYSQSFQNQNKELEKQKELQQQLADLADSAAKKRNELVDELNATLQNQKNTIENNLALGKISSRQALDQLLAIQRVRKETKGLAGDTKQQIEDTTAILNGIKRVLSDLDVAFQDLALGDNAADTFGKAIKSSLQAKDALSELTKEQRRLPEAVEIGNKAITSQVQALNAFTDAQVEARNRLIEFAATQASLRLDEQFSQAASQINQAALVNDRSELLNTNLEAQNSIRDVQLAQLDIAKQTETVRQNLAKLAAEERVLAEQQLQLEQEANRSGIENYNRTKIQNVAQVRLTKLVEAQKEAVKEQLSLESLRDTNSSTIEANEKRVLELLKEQRQAAQDIANARKNAANQVLDFRKKLLLTSTNRDELTPQEEAGFLRARLANTQTALKQAFTFEAVTEGANELLDLYREARASGQFTADELEKVFKVIKDANVRIGTLNPQEQQQREASLREQSITALRANTEILRSSNAALALEIKQLTDEIKGFKVQQNTLLPQSIDQSALASVKDVVGRASQQFRESQGTKVSELTGKETRLLAATSQSEFIASFTGTILKGADNLKLTTTKLLDNFKGLQSTGLETVRVTTRLATANLKIVERVEEAVKNLDLKTAGENVDNALVNNPLTLATEDLVRLRDNLPKPNPATDDVKNSDQGISDMLKKQDAVLTQIGNAIEKDKEVIINLSLDGSGATDFERAIVDALYERLKVNPSPTNDIR